MRTVVIPSDFSENAFNALKYAAELFKYEKSDFFVLHAFAEKVYEQLEATNNQDPAGLRKEVYRESMKYAIRKEEAINRAIEELNIDFLVMVNSRQTYLENMLSESTIDKIGQHPRIPFLVLQNYHRS